MVIYNNLVNITFSFRRFKTTKLRQNKNNISRMFLSTYGISVEQQEIKKDAMMTSITVLKEFY